MKKLMLWAVVVALAAALIFWIAGYVVESRSTSRPWPGKLGTLREVPGRYPPTAQSPAATELVRLATAAGVNLTPGKGEQQPVEKIRGSLADYIRAQIERSGDEIDVPPPLVTKYLADHAAQFDAVRDHLLSGEPIVWRSNFGDLRDENIPNLFGHLQLSRVFVTRALDKARNGDALAWEDLHAAWELSRPLWKRPEIITTLIALASSRMVNAAARKMPDPKEPEWLAEMRALDATGAMIASQQAEAWRIGQLGDEIAAYAPSFARALMRPFYRLPAARSVEQIRQYTHDLARSGACEVAKVPAQLGSTPNVVAAFRRVLRYRAEVEATERVLQLRRGETPSAKSQCTDGSWIVTPRSVRFSREIRVDPPGHKIPLQYELRSAPLVFHTTPPAR